MEFGCCLNMVAARLGVPEWDLIEDCARAGYDYVDFSVNTLAGCSEEEFRTLSFRMQENGLKSIACNSMLLPSHDLISMRPGDMRLDTYLHRALRRARILGVRYFGLGSGASRNIPGGIPRSEAEAGLRQWIRYLAWMAEEYDITLLIEPLCKAETNYLNTLEEASALQKSLDGARVLLLLDYFHMKMEEEPLAHIGQAADAIAHVHIADVSERRFPVPERSAKYAAFVSALHESGYQAGISIEAYTDSFHDDMRSSLALLKEICGQPHQSN